MRRHAICLLGLISVLPNLSAFAAAPPQPPGVSFTAFVGDITAQKFVHLTGRYSGAIVGGPSIIWHADLLRDDGSQWPGLFEATSTTYGGITRWSYSVRNDEPGTTICEVSFPEVSGVTTGPWSRTRVYWPSLYQGALISDLSTPEAFAAQCREACKGVPYLYGAYQGDLCMSWFVQTGPAGSFGMMALDPTHEVLTFYGHREKAGMRYSIVAHPRVETGRRWQLGDIDVFRSRSQDWHVPADRYRAWLRREGFGYRPHGGDIASMVYSRWDELRPAEVIRWAKAYGVRDVNLWVQLYGRGDQYYPCYFPPQKLGVAGMTAELGELRAAGLVPYFYTNGYLLSPLQTPADVAEWTKKYPKAYPAWVAKGDTGYASTVAAFRALGFDFAGDWLSTPGGILPLRVRRVNFHWGEYPIYFWHQRPFYAACVASPQWQKLFRDTARLHATMGAGGMCLDQVGAIAPELCSAKGHGHDDDSFGMWNRAYLRLLAETKRAGAALQPGFFLEAEGAADLYAEYIDRYYCWFGPPPRLGFERMLRYAVPWVRADLGSVNLDDTAAVARHCEDTLLLGSVFRVSGGVATGPDNPKDPHLTCEGMKLLHAAIAARRELSPYMDGGRFMDDVGLTATGCDAARWFDGKNGILLAARATAAGAKVVLRPSATKGLKPASAWRLNWKTGAKSPAQVDLAGGRIVFALPRTGLNLVVVPR